MDRSAERKQDRQRKLAAGEGAAMRGRMLISFVVVKRKKTSLDYTWSFLFSDESQLAK